MAKILFITSYYPPEKGAVAVRISENAAHLMRRGHQVSVLTTLPNYPTGIVPPEYRGHLIQQENLHGIRVVRVWSYVTANKGFLRRILAQLSFGCLAPLLGWRKAGRPDLIIVESHPLFNAIAGRVLAWWKRCPFVFTVSDLWPESAVQLGVLHNRLLIWLSERLEWSTYRRAGFVWVLTEGLRTRLVERGLSAGRIFLLTNGVDIEKFRPLPHAEARAELGWDERFTVLYAGNHGLAQGLTTIVDAAERLQQYEDIRIVFAGDGAAKAELIGQVQRRNLNNVSFLASQPHERMPQLLASASVCLVPLRKMPLFEGALPSKMFEIMACGRPIILGVEGEARERIEREAGAALAVAPEDPAALAEAILHLRDHPEEAELLGQRGRKYAETHFDRNRLTAELDARLAGLLGKKARTALPEVPGFAALSAASVSLNAVGSTTLEESRIQAQNNSIDIQLYACDEKKVGL